MKLFNTIPLWVLGLFAALVLLIEAPLIAFPFYAGDFYQGINIAHYGNDEHHYLTRGKEILEGHALGQMYLSEWKDSPDSFQMNIEQIYVMPIRLLGGEKADVAMLYNVMNGIGVFILLILMYLFAYLLSRNTVVATASAIFTVGGYVLIENGTILKVLLTGGQIIYSNFNVYGRSAAPYMPLVPFFGFLILTYKSATAQFERISRTTYAPYVYVAAAGTLFGVLFYSYFYAWTYALALLGSLTLSAIIFRKWHAAIATVGIGSLGLLVGSFKLYGYYTLFTSPLGEQFSYFFQTMHSREFIESTTGIAVTLLLALYVYTNRNDKNAFFITALVMASWVALEQQMITGRTVQYGHYYWYFVVPLAILISVYMLSRIIPSDWSRWWKMFCLALVLVSFLNTAAGQYRSFFITAPYKMREQDFAPLVQKLASLPKGVVLTDFGGSSYPFLITIYTDDDLYWIPAATTSAFPYEHMKEALFVYLYINKDSRRDPVAYLESALATSTRSAYVDLYEHVEGVETGIPRPKYEKAPFPRTDTEVLTKRAAFLPEIGKAYQEFLRSQQSIRAALIARDVKYILWDVRQYPEWDLAPLGPLTLIATSTDLVLYKF